MLKQNKKSLIFASLLTLLPMLAGFILWDRLPDRLPTHWGFNGEADDFSSKAFAVFGLPLIMLALLWVCVIFSSIDKRNKEQNPKVKNMVIWIIPFLSCVVSAATYCQALGYDISIPNLIFAAFGVMFIIIGNYMPKCKINSTIGVRIKWTLENEENWNKTHRLAGKLWFLCGLILVICAFLPKTVGAIIAGAVLVLAVAVPIVYSYVYYRKQLNNNK